MRFQKYEKLEFKKNKLKLDIDFLNNCKHRGSIRNSVSLNCRMFLMKTLYQLVKGSFVTPSITVMKNFNIFQKNSVYPETFYLISFLLLASTLLQNLYHRITRNHCRARYTLNKKSYVH